MFYFGLGNLLLCDSTLGSDCGGRKVDPLAHFISQNPIADVPSLTLLDHMQLCYTHVLASM